MVYCNNQDQDDSRDQVSANPQTPVISIVVPVYNEEFGLEEFTSNLLGVAARLTIPSEVIVVDDCSDDNTPLLLKKHSRISYIRNDRRLGYGFSLKRGIRQARGKIICIIDADNQYSPQSITALLSRMDKHDMVVGARLESGPAARGPMRQRIIKRLICVTLSLLFRQKILDINSGLRLMDRRTLLPYLEILSERFSFTSSLTLAMLLERRRIKYLPIPYFTRSGKSKVREFSYSINFIKACAKIIARKLFRGKLS